MSNIKTIQQMVDALASIANEPDRTLQQRPVRFAKAKEAIQAGRVLLESIAKQEQGEPVAYVHADELEELSHCNGMSVWAENALAHTDDSLSKQLLPSGYVALYPGPQQRKPLTDDEFTTAIEVEGIPVEDVELVWAIKDLVEAAHGIKE